ncbi:MAG: LPS export ABC transporter periplasmic protein LptC [Bacteroidales bacterium]|nr:LPS export ABC transporter periplasmic protein LptC [Bacteroidales bacterium]MBR5430768.1 LPS export ABC transporter periplasmic protein LptC [Bacteroidales bacterium]
MKKFKNTAGLVAITLVVATVLFSCSGKLKQAETLNLEETPRQTVDSVFAVQTENGRLKMRMEAPLLERYEKDTVSIEVFPKGFALYGYNSEGLLETTIVSEKASHYTYKSTNGELWEVTGGVVIQNVIQQETMETDTLYWDRFAGKIYTDSYIRMYSRDGFMQGYGMQSDENAHDAVLLRPFNSYSVVVQDTTAVIIDSVNFIGPFIKK